jgi:hypothetical protein
MRLTPVIHGRKYWAQEIRGVLAGEFLYVSGQGKKKADGPIPASIDDQLTDAKNEDALNRSEESVGALHHWSRRTSRSECDCRYESRPQAAHRTCRIPGELTRGAGHSGGRTALSLGISRARHHPLAPLFG